MSQLSGLVGSLHYIGGTETLMVYQLHTMSVTPEALRWLLPDRRSASLQNR